MAFVEPSVEDFLDRYPEFIDSDPDFLARLLKLAVARVGTRWAEGSRLSAILALTAYWTEQGQSQISSLTGETVAGPIIMESVGPLSVRYQTGQQSGQFGGGRSAGVTVVSPYLAEYERLLKINFPAVAIV